MKQQQQQQQEELRRRRQRQRQQPPAASYPTSTLLLTLVLEVASDSEKKDSREGAQCRVKKEKENVRARKKKKKKHSSFSSFDSREKEEEEEEEELFLPLLSTQPLPSASNTAPTMLPFSRQHSAPTVSRHDFEKDAKVFLQPSVSSSSLPASATLPASSSPFFNRSSSGSSSVNSRRARSILALALTLLALVLVSFFAWGSPSGPQPLSSRDEAALPPPQPLRLSSLTLPPPPSPPRRRPRPSAEAAVVAAALASADVEDNKKSDAGFPLAVVRAPLLTQAELLTLQHYARGSVYGEWGSGASTVLAAPMARRAVSIENQKTWCDEMRASSDVDFWIKNGVLTYLCVDTGATGSFGTPTAESDPALFGRYLDALDDAAAAVKMATAKTTATALKTTPKRAAKRNGAFSSSSSSSTRLSLSGLSAAQAQAQNLPTTSSSNAFTVVLVDGRFRVACALKALWHLDHARGVLLVHDWVARGQQYHAPILRRYSLVAVVDRLAVLVPSSPTFPSSPAVGADDEEEKEKEEARARWWKEAAEEMEKFSRDAA